MTKKEARALILKYNAGQCTAAEQQLIENWYQQFALDEDTGLSEKDFDDLKQEMWNTLPAEVNEVIIVRKYKLWPRIAAAASVFIALSAGIYFYTFTHSGENKTSKNLLAGDIAPGKNRASITLSNGKTINLSDVKTGVVVDVNSLKYSDGTAILTGTSDDLPGVIEMTSISTPKGGTYQVILPDGSKVQLNAASSIKFASNFKSLAKRSIELSGEAYFEIAKNKKRPFVVRSKNQEVMVLGTHFNVSAYSDEQDSKTTLLEGSIQINQKILRPNQQAVQAGGKINVRDVNANDAVDWKNGEFICRNESLDNIMRKIARWYDVDVVYSDPELRNRTFSGSLSRYDHVLDVLKALEFAGTMKFKLENRKIQVL